MPENSNICLNLVSNIEVRFNLLSNIYVLFITVDTQRVSFTGMFSSEL